MKKLSMLLVLSMAAVTFAGCGADKADTTADTVTQDVVEENTENEESAATADAISDAIADGVLKVGTNAEFPPFEYVGDDGIPDGFDMALVREIGSRMGVEVEVENMEFDSLVASIGTKIDVAIAGMTVTEERQNMVEFSDAYYEAVQYVILPADSEIATVDELAGKKIGVQIGTTGDFIATDDIPDSEVSSYNKAVDAVNDLVNGRVEAVIIDKNPALVFEERFEGQVKAVDGAAFGFEAENYAIAMPKGDAALVEAVNKALEEIKADGTFDSLVAEYIEAE